MGPDSQFECPSALCEPGANLLGVVLPDGKIAHLAACAPVDRTFVAIAEQGRSPAKRFRFSSPCRRDDCRQWWQGRCSVIDTLLVDLGSADTEGPVPRCPIRPDCRWFRQVGAKACRVCADVVTDNSERFAGADRPASIPSDWA